MNRIGPQLGPQTAVLSCPADIAILGGSAGGGKTYSLLLEPTRHIHNPGFNAVVFRRTYPQIMQKGGMWQDSSDIYPLMGAQQHLGNVEWKFPSGAAIAFRHLVHEDTKYEYLGAQIPLMCFDQLEQFTGGQFWYMFARSRSTCGVRPYIRATVNPDPDSFVAEMVSWWIDQEDGYPILERSGKMRWFVRIGEEIVWGDSSDELVEKHPGSFPKSFTFILATPYDNRILMEKDPAYISNLQALLPVDRERLLGHPLRGGNWKIRPSAGKIFNRDWFEVVESVPRGGVECRFWDFAGVQRDDRHDPDYTSATKMRLVGGIYFVTDQWDAQEGPAEIDRTFLEMARADKNQSLLSGSRYLVRWEIEPGSAGLREANRLVQALAGYDAEGIPSAGQTGKYIRAKPFALQAKAGAVKLLRAPWNERWINHLHNQPMAANDDIMDSSVGAFQCLTDDGGEAQFAMDYAAQSLVPRLSRRT